MKFLIAAGGTGGHITPGIAIAKALKEDGHEIVFVGTEQGMEKDLIPKAGFELKYIHASGLSAGIKNKIKAINNLNKGVTDCLKIIEEYEPDMCIGTGGYVTAPLMFAAHKLKVHSIIHESNALPGKTTDLMCSYVDKVCVGFKEAKEKLKKKNVVVTGNPNKMNLNSLTKNEAKSKIGIEGKLLLIFGGSQGAKKINSVILEIIKEKQFEDYNVIYATGPKNYDEIANQIICEDSSKYELINNEEEEEIVLYKLPDESNSITYTSKKSGKDKDVKTIDTNISHKDNKIVIKKFIYNMEEVMKASDLVVCRSGALTCTEIAEVGVASILIPFPYAAENHQFYNAQTLKNANAGIIIEEKSLTSQLLIEGINSILNDNEMISKMAHNSKTLRTGNPIENIKNEIYSILS